SGSKTLYPVEGKVVHKGKEINGAVVTFHPKDGDPVTAIRPIGLTGEDGKFKLTTGQNPGAPAGEYIVTFIWPKEKEATKKEKKVMTMNMGADTYDFF